MSARVTGSFRDPSGYVFAHDERIFRAIDPGTYSALSDLAGAGLLEKFIRERQVVATRFVADAALLTEFREAHPGGTSFLEHERLEYITFPYEWTITMLADAALLTLDLQITLAGQGFALKDATAYNIQFRDGRPIFIDLSSIKRPKRLDVWFALGQFQRHFLFPLLLAVKRGWDLRSYFLGNLDGLGPAQVLANFRGLGKWSPGLLLDLTLPAMLENKGSATKGKTWEASKEKPAGDAGAQLINLKRLRRKIASLAASYRTSGAWHDYTATCTYDDAAESSKRKRIAAFLVEVKPRTVLDFGCNSGDYSYLAAEQGCTVMAADADHDAAELLHRRLREKPARITAMVVNAANPSPAIGYMNTERASFLERFAGAPDCVFALALIHHLLVSANLTLALIRDLFATLTARWLILEFVPTSDVQFQRLLQFRENLFARITLDVCLEVFGERFTVLAQQPVAGTGRTLLFLEKRA
jgi:SAM-dependent methyltransferase